MISLSHDLTTGLKREGSYRVLVAFFTGYVKEILFRFNLSVKLTTLQLGMGLGDPIGGIITD